ncbi:hypothetical protein RPW65_04665 [Pseudomonas sp. NyZ704]|nr:hypothetical protein RPW65_04665 [Pseudomonas sp. NyZ704]
MKLPLLLCLSTLTLTACSFAGHMAKEGALSLTERSGREHFTLEGKLPANFELMASAQYQVLDEDKCQVRNFGASGTSTRSMVIQQRTELNDYPHDFSLKIPLTHHVGSCHSELYRVALYVTGHYDERNDRQSRHGGGLGIVDTRPDNAPAFDNEGRLYLRGMCGWMFQSSRLYAGIDKLLHCSQPDENWSQDYDLSKRRGLGATLGRDELAGKTVTLEIREDPQERPSHRNTWIQFPEGWKPCEPKPGGWMRCQEPPIFKTFQMDGQECTVYPNCTE